MMFVSGLMGPYMSPIPANASMAMLFSLLRRGHRSRRGCCCSSRRRHFAAARRRQPHARHRRDGPLLYRASRGLLDGPRGGRKLFLLAVGVATLGVCVAVRAPRMCAVKLLPFDNKSEFQVVVDMPRGLARSRTPSAC